MSLGNQAAVQTKAVDQVFNTILELSNGTIPAKIVRERVTTTAPDERISTTRSTISSYATMTSPDEGISLSFVHTPVVNGMKCAKIRPKDVHPKIEYWNLAVLCSVLGANPPLEVVEGFIKRIWKAFDVDKIFLVKKGVFLVRFKHLSEQSIVVQRRVDFFDNKPFLVKPWNEEMDINTETLVLLPIWVTFLELDIKYWGLDNLSKIGSVLGIPIKIDKYTRDKSFLRYARVLIERQLQDNFAEYIEFVNEHNVVARQNGEHDWKPTKCSFYKMFGHIGKECRKRPQPRTG